MSYVKVETYLIPLEKKIKAERDLSQVAPQWGLWVPVKIARPQISLYYIDKILDKQWRHFPLSKTSSKQTISEMTTWHVSISRRIFSDTSLKSVVLRAIVF